MLVKRNPMPFEYSNIAIVTLVFDNGAQPHILISSTSVGNTTRTPEMTQMVLKAAVSSSNSVADENRADTHHGLPWTHRSRLRTTTPRAMLAVAPTTVDIHPSAANPRI